MYNIIDNSNTMKTCRSFFALKREERCEAEMNVTSVLSNGYLQPAGRPVLDDLGAVRMQSAALALREQKILAEESALKSSSGQVSTTYHYTVGPDGRRYITSAEVVVRGSEQELDDIPGGVKRQEPKSGSDKAFETDSDTKASGGKTADADENSDAVRKLKQTEQEVIAHEAAHQAAGGRFAGPVSYTYTQGPDGKRYITGGEVPIHVPAGDDPEQTLRDMQQIQRAALAPGNPSGQDLSVAAQAASVAMQARRELAADGTETPGAKNDFFKTGVASIQADIRFGRNLSKDPTELRAVSVGIPEAAYARAASPYGLWTPARGFEPGTSPLRTHDRLNIAA